MSTIVTIKVGPNALELIQESVRCYYQYRLWLATSNGGLSSLQKALEEFETTPRSFQRPNTPSAEPRAIMIVLEELKPILGLFD